MFYIFNGNNNNGISNGHFTKSLHKYLTFIHNVNIHSQNIYLYF